MNGIITAKKLPDAHQYYVIGSRDYDAFLQLSGSWLSDAGFGKGDISGVRYDDGVITLFKPGLRRLGL